MKLSYDRTSKDPTYFIQQGVRNGNKTTTHNVKRIGKYSELLKITDDPLAYAQDAVKKYNEDYKSGKVAIHYTVDFDKKLPPANSPASTSTLSNVGYFVLQKIYHDLDVASFFKKLQSGHKSTFDFNTVNRFLTFARLLDPLSKLGTYDKLDAYYEKPSFEYQHILRFLDVLEHNYDAYLEHLFLNSSKVMKRNTSICYYDCTNYYFEIEDNDEYVDEATGEILQGLRRYGLSKQHQPSPLVQMGLFMDGNGIPISMCIHSGSTNEQKTVLPLEKKITEMFQGKPFVYCADAGLGSYDIRSYNSMGGRSFVITQSIKKLSAILQEAVFNDFDYKRLSDDEPMTIQAMKGFDKKDKENLSLYNDCIYKILQTNHAMDTGLYEERFFKNGNSHFVKSKGMLKQRIIITFSRKAMEYQRHVRNAQIERAEKMLDTKNVGEIKKGPNDAARFIKRISVGKSGEKASTHYEINQAVIQKEEMYDGYYAIVTNLEDRAQDILKINSGRYKIEDCFRIMKTNFKSRPVYHRNPNRIVAHFMTCYTALLLYRLLENKLKEQGTPCSTGDILETLRNMNVANIHDRYYQSVYTSSKVCTALNAAYNLGLDKENYKITELNKKIKKISS